MSREVGRIPLPLKSGSLLRRRFMSQYPFLDRIHPDKRLSVINALGTYQRRRHKCDLDCVADFKSRRYDPMSTPAMEPLDIRGTDFEDVVDEINIDIARNSDIKGRMD